MSRRHSGKTPVVMVVKRAMLYPLIPIWIFYVLFGFDFIIAPPGQIKCEFGQPIQTEWGYLIDTLYIFCAWSSVMMFCFALLGVLTTGTIDFLYRNNAAQRAWRQAGGQPFIDALGPPFNNDSDTVSEAIPPPPPPTANCPNCGGAFTLWNGYQCGNCGLYWDGNQFWTPPTSTS